MNNNATELETSSEIPLALRQYISDGTPFEIQERYASLPKIAELSDFGVFDEDVVVIDTETTGFSFHHDELTQIAAARMVHGEITEWFVTFVNPGKPIPEDVAYLTNITDDDVKDALSPQEALAQLASFVGESLVIAHNVEFDKTFTTRHPEGYPLLQNTWIDTLDLSRIVLPRFRSHRLLDLVRAFECPLSTHRADADVEATCAIFRILLAGVAAMPPALVCTIADFAPLSDWSTGIVFQEFKRAYHEQVYTDQPALFEEVSRETFSVISEIIPQGTSQASEPVAESESETEALETTEVVKVTEATEAASDTEAPTPSQAQDDLFVLRKEDLRFSLKNLRKNRLVSLPLPQKKVELPQNTASDEGLSMPTEEEIAAAFSEDGLLSVLYGDFEERPEQLMMSQAVREAFSNNENIVIEAGTGVGKSMAYLLPSALLALKNNITVGVATKTNALLDQLIYHELPHLAEALAEQNPELRPLTFAPLKGFANYPCLWRVERLAKEGPSMREVQNKEYSQAPALAGLLSYIEQTSYDDISSLKIDFRLLPRSSFTTSSQECLRRKCPFYGTQCFVFGSRLRAEASDIIVTNHSLLFRDLDADGMLLSPSKYWVLDEAHNAENEARSAFSLELSAEGILSIARKISSSEASKNPFVRLERQVLSDSAGAGATPIVGLVEKARTISVEYADCATTFSEAIKMLLFFDESKQNKSYETVDLWISPDIRTSATFTHVKNTGQELMAVAERLITVCQNIAAYLEDYPQYVPVQREIAALAFGLKEQIQAGEIILVQAPENYAYAAVLNRKKDKVTDKLQALILDIGDKMNETLYARTNSVVFASATLTIAHTFESFNDSVGLNRTEVSPARFIQLDSSYDFDRAMTIYVVEDMPEPTQSGYLKALQTFLIDLHIAQEGSLLTLFTNRREMEQCFDTVYPALKEQDLRLVCQKWGVSVKGLSDDFMKDEHLSLFALKSFWEGFDAPGSTLKGVVIPKLPFSKPSDPLYCERAYRDNNAWRHYVLPGAVLETKQAAGRLIRKADDKGILVLADRRLLTKSYGKVFLESMPSRTIKVLPAAKIIEEITLSK